MRWPASRTSSVDERSARSGSTWRPRPGVPRPAGHPVDRARAPGTPTRDLSRTPVRGWGRTGWRRRLPGGARTRSTRRRGFRLAGIPPATPTRWPARWCPTRNRRASQTLGGLLDVTQGEPPDAAPPPDPVGVQVALPRVRHADLALRGLRPEPAAVHRPGRPPRGGVCPRPARPGPDRAGLPVARPATRSRARCPGYVRIDPCPYGTARATPTWSAPSSSCGARASAAPRSWWTAGTSRRAGALARYGVQTLEKIGLRARRARTARERARAQLRFTSVTPDRPVPGRYLDLVTDAGIRSDVGALERDPEHRRAPAGRPWTATWWRAL